MDKKENIEHIIHELEKRKKVEIDYLKSHSKPLFELIVEERFNVEEVISQSYTNYFTPTSETKFGGLSPVYKAGFSSKLILKVSPINQDVPIRSLIFNGFSIVRAGDYISAKIPKYKEKIIEDPYSLPYDNYNIFYLERDFYNEENAIELIIVSKDSNILRKDRAVDYEYFIKK